MTVDKSRGLEQRSMQVAHLFKKIASQDTIQYTLITVMMRNGVVIGMIALFVTVIRLPCEPPVV